MENFTIDEILNNIKDNYISAEKHGDNVINIIFGITNHVYYAGILSFNVENCNSNIWIYDTEHITDPRNVEEVTNNGYDIEIPNQKEFLMKLLLTIIELIER